MSRGYVDNLCFARVDHISTGPTKSIYPFFSAKYKPSDGGHLSGGHTAVLAKGPHRTKADMDNIAGATQQTEEPHQVKVQLLCFPHEPGSS